MIGFNGGLIGADRTTSLSAAVGVWTLDEQTKARRNLLWPTVGVSASGGTETTITDGGISYKVHTFLSGGTFTVSEGGLVEYLVVGGGGGGGVQGS